ncbi:hypothetical protein ACFLV5_04820 [Chloroflexota bacterium]
MTACITLVGYIMKDLYPCIVFARPETAFRNVMGNPDFDPDLQTRIIMGMGGSLMTGWTFLLLWAVREPIERRVVILLTAFPVVFGLFIVTLIWILGGNTSSIWIQQYTTVIDTLGNTCFRIALEPLITRGTSGIGALSLF